MQQEKLLTIKQNSIADITEKKSKFIAEVFYVQTVADAEKIIDKIEKREYKAKHHCIAYRIMEESLVEKMSDDGEPSGTAGAPMLSILQGKGLVNVLAVVTRYFGGILLGTGGLVKAYSESLTTALDKAETKMLQRATEISFDTDYSEIEKIKYYLTQINGKSVSFDYFDNIKAIILIPNCYVQNFIDDFQKLPFKIKNVKIIQQKFVDI